MSSGLAARIAERDKRFGGGDESRVQALMAENQLLREQIAIADDSLANRRVRDLLAENKRLLDALVAMDEAVCHGSPETAKRIAREAYEPRCPQCGTNDHSWSSHPL